MKYHAMLGAKSIKYLPFMLQTECQSLPPFNPLKRPTEDGSKHRVTVSISTVITGRAKYQDIFLTNRRQSVL